MLGWGAGRRVFWSGVCGSTRVGGAFYAPTIIKQPTSRTGHTRLHRSRVDAVAEALEADTAAALRRVLERKGQQKAAEGWKMPREWFGWW